MADSKSKPTDKRFIDLTGLRFQKLVVLRYFGRHKKPSGGSDFRWVCQCDCGQTTETATTTSLKNGNTRSCGCLKKEIGDRVRRHGMTGTAIYIRWKDMNARCYNRANKEYKNYGGRGITICKRWHKFENFYADMGDIPKGHSIDRINNDGPYSPTNCRWATIEVQANNKRTNRIITYQGKSQTLSMWAKELGIRTHTLHARLSYYGYSIEEAFQVILTPIHLSRACR